MKIQIIALITLLIVFGLISGCGESNSTSASTGEVVAFRFTGTIDAVNGSPSFSASVGDVVTGIFSFDPSATARSKTYAHQVFYFQTAPTEVQVAVGSTALKVQPSPAADIDFSSMSPMDVFEAVGSPIVINNYTWKFFTPAQASTIARFFSNTLQATEALTLDQSTAIAQKLDEHMAMSGGVVNNAQALSSLFTTYPTIQNAYVIKVANNYVMGTPTDSISWSVNDIVTASTYGLDYISIGLVLSDSNATSFQDERLPSILRLEDFSSSNLVISGNKISNNIGEPIWSFNTKISSLTRVQ